MRSFWRRKPLGGNCNNRDNHDRIHRIAKRSVFFGLRLPTIGNADTKSHADSESPSNSLWSHSHRKHSEAARMANLRWMRE